MNIDGQQSTSTPLPRTQLNSGESFALGSLPLQRHLSILEQHCRDLTPSIVKAVQEVVLPRYPESNSFHPWYHYNVQREDVLCWANCAQASRILGKKLEEAEIHISPMTCYKMPFGSVPYQFRRGEDPFPPRHMLLHHQDEDGLVIIDPTYQQFLSLLCRHNIPALKEALPDQILVMRATELPTVAQKLSSLARELSQDYWTTCWGTPERMQEDFYKYWSPANFVPSRDTDFY